MQSNRNGFWAQDPAVKAGQWRLYPRLVIDMLLDCDLGLLKFKQVPIEAQVVFELNGNEKELEYNSEVIVLTGLENKMVDEKVEAKWIPHLNVYTAGSTVSILKIQCMKFGQK